MRWKPINHERNSNTVPSITRIALPRTLGVGCPKRVVGLTCRPAPQNQSNYFLSPPSAVSGSTSSSVSPLSPHHKSSQDLKQGLRSDP